MIVLSVGERGVIALLAVDRQQAKIALNYIQGMIADSPILSQMVEKQNTDGVQFDNRVSIEVHTNSFRAIRGRTLLAVLFDEVAFFRSDHTASPDIEVYRAAIPSLATTNGLLIGFSSPYAKRGLLYEKYRKHYGQNTEILVVQGSTRQFNPTINPEIIKDAIEDDPEAAKSEWLGLFRDDIEAYATREIIEKAIRPSPLEIPPDNKYRHTAFVDPSGGGSDEFCLSIGHVEGETVVVDLVRGLTGTPSEIVEEYARIIKSYGILEIFLDRYAGSLPSDEFRRWGIDCKYTDKNKSQLYIELLPILNSGLIELPNDSKLINQLTLLERRTNRSGRDSIDHPLGGHDDRANVIAGLAAHTALKHCQKVNANVRWVA